MYTCLSSIFAQLFHCHPKAFILCSCFPPPALTFLSVWKKTCAHIDLRYRANGHEKSICFRHLSGGGGGFLMFRMMGFDLYCTQVKMNTEVFFSLVISTFWKLKIASEFHSLQSASILEISYYLHFWPPCTVRVHTVIGWILLLLILLLFIYFVTIHSCSRWVVFILLWRNHLELNWNCIVWQTIRILILILIMLCGHRIIGFIYDSRDRTYSFQL